MLKQQEPKGYTVFDVPNMDWIERHYGTQILRWIRSRIHSHADAEDVRQDSYMRIQQSLPKWKGECSLSTWIFTIVKRTIQDYYRRKGLQDKIQPPTPKAPLDPSEQASQREYYQKVRDMLQKLSEDHRIILTLRGLNEFSFRASG